MQLSCGSWCGIRILTAFMAHAYILLFHGAKRKVWFWSKFNRNNQHSTHNKKKTSQNMYGFTIQSDIGLKFSIYASRFWTVSQANHIYTWILDNDNNEKEESSNLTNSTFSIKKTWKCTHSKINKITKHIQAHLVILKIS